MRSRNRVFAVTLIAVFAVTVSLTAQAPWRPGRVPERHVVPLAVSGEGGILLVQGSAELCADRGLELVVRRNLPAEAAFQYVGRWPVVATCNWEFHDLLPGLYDAVIQYHDDLRIVATGQVELGSGGTGLIELVKTNVEIQGTVSIDHVPDPGSLRLTFKDGIIPPWDWVAPVDQNGRYRVTLQSTGTICAWVGRSSPFIALAKCTDVFPGLQQFDLDFPPGIIRIHVKPIAEATLPEWISISVKGPVEGGSRSVKPKDGFQGDVFGWGYGHYLLTLATTDKQTTYDSREVTLSPELPESDVTLTMPAQR